MIQSLPPDPSRPRRTYADHLRDWDAARAAIASARELLPKAGEPVVVTDLALWFHQNGSTLLDAMENLLDATAFKSGAALDRQTEIVQRFGAGR